MAKTEKAAAVVARWAGEGRREEGARVGVRCCLDGMSCPVVCPSACVLQWQKHQRLLTVQFVFQPWLSGYWQRGALSHLPWQQLVQQQHEAEPAQHGCHGFMGVQCGAWWEAGDPYGGPQLQAAGLIAGIHQPDHHQRQSQDDDCGTIRSHKLVLKGLPLRRGPPRVHCADHVGPAISACRV